MATNREDAKLKEVTSPAVETPESPAKKRPIRLIVGGVLAVGLILVGVYWLMNRGYESTDDAQLDANVVPVPARVGGPVVDVFFEENQPVKAGQKLAEIDSTAYKAKVAAAEAELAAAKAAADSSIAEVSMAQASGSKEITSARAALSAATSARETAQLDLTRAKNLFEEHAITRQKLDAAQAAFDGADANYTQAKARLEAAVTGASEGTSKAEGTVQAQIAQAKARAAAALVRIESAQAALDLARLELSWTTITASEDGVASKKTIVKGQMVGPGQPVAQIVPDHDLWVTANFKETQLASMKVDQPAEIKVDAYPGLKLHGKVRSFSGATGARFSLLPPENATGNFTKV
ncbi:MAG TPA: HlyD family secretion protein, partial [bacterium]|nr:HlyD family secretion protein [bacterium]